MRVLFFTQFYPPEVGAAQNRMHTFATHLARQGHDVTVVAEVPNQPEGVIRKEYRGRLVRREEEDGVEVIRLWVACSPRKGTWRRILLYGSYMLGATVAGVVMGHRRYDAVFATSPPLPTAVPGLVASLVCRAPLVVDVRDLWPEVAVVLGELDPDGLLTRFAEWLERLVYGKAAAVTCVTRDFTEHVRDNGAHPERVFHLPNGTVPDIFSPRRTDPSLRTELGLDGKFVVGYCGNHGLAQGLGTVLEAARQLRGDDRFRFLFVGEGAEKEELVAGKEKHGLDNVIFRDPVPQTEIVPYITMADVMLVPLKADPIFRSFVPSKLFDYLACGTPVVLMVGGEAREILEEAEAGVFVEPGDPSALAGALRELSGQRDRLGEMGRRGRAYVLRHYDRSDQAAKLEGILHDAAFGNAERSGDRVP